MNWYEHHIKDYAASVQYHSWDEDMAYTRMIRLYYRTEKALAGDAAEVCRLIGARTPEQQVAVETILRDFFRLEADGLHHNERCDEDIGAYLAGQPERDAKKKNEETRLERHRRERAELFAALNEAGEHMPYNVPMADLRAKVEALRVSGRVTAPVAAPATPPSVETPPATPATPPATAPATLATATHPPPTTHQPPEEDILSGGVAAPPPPAAKAKRARAEQPEKPTVAVWEAYASAYEHRYRAAPIRNQKVNGQLSQFVTRVPTQEAPAIAAFFVAHENLLYVRAMHPVDLLLRDAEALRTQWATGMRTTDRALPAPTARASRMAEAMGMAPPADPRTVDVEARHVADPAYAAARIGR